jgi:hypothetical protein
MLLGMKQRRAGYRLPLAAAAIAAAVGGHALTYLLTVPAAQARALLLAESGHGYWPTAVAAALVLGLVSLASTAARHFLRGFRQPARAPAPGRPERLERLALRLALLQISIYAVQEVVERLAAGAPVGGVLHDGVLPIGILVQILVACAVALALAVLGHAAEAAGRALARRIARPGGTTVIDRPAPGLRASWRHTGSLGSRAPPLT